VIQEVAAVYAVSKATVYRALQRRPSPRAVRRGTRLTLVLAGHPRLRNDLRRPAREETGTRTTIFAFEGIQG
jgi:type II secretory pathway predicted ATPase ExeA